MNPNSSFPPITVVVNVATYAFSLVQNSVTVSGAGWPSVTVSTTTDILPAFTDVGLTDPNLDAINLMRQYGITSGCLASPARYCPNDSVTRGQMAVFIVRSVMGGDNFTYNSLPYFTDVPANHIFFQWIQKLKELGITAGCSTTQFCPDSSITQGQMAVFVVKGRYGSTVNFSYPPAPYFTDVPSTHGFFPWIQKMRQTGISTGCSPTLFCPDSVVTRGQMAGLIIKGAFNQLLPPNTPVVASISPTTAPRGQTLLVTITGQNTNFAPGISQVTFGPGTTVLSANATNSTTILVELAVDDAATPGPRSIIVTTGAEEAALPNGLRIQ